MIEKIKETFEKYFQPWGIKFPENYQEGLIQDGWQIKYKMTQEGFLFQAAHRMTSTQACRIHPDGKLESLPYHEQEFFAVGKTDEETEANQKAMQENNQNYCVKMRALGINFDFQ